MVSNLCTLSSSEKFIFGVASSFTVFGLEYDYCKIFYVWNSGINFGIGHA